MTSTLNHERYRTFTRACEHLDDATGDLARVADLLDHEGAVDAAESVRAIQQELENRSGFLSTLSPVVRQHLLHPQPSPRGQWSRLNLWSPRS